MHASWLAPVLDLAQEVLHQHGHGPPRSALVFAAAPCRTGDVKVGPWIAARKPRQEAGGRYGAGRWAADVRDIGKVGAQLLLVGVVQRQEPGGIVGVPAGRQKGVEIGRAWGRERGGKYGRTRGGGG